MMNNNNFDHHPNIINTAGAAAAARRRHGGSNGKIKVRVERFHGWIPSAKFIALQRSKLDSQVVPMTFTAHVMARAEDRRKGKESEKKRD